MPLRWQCPTAVQTRVYTTKSDVYSFGVLVWELFSSGATPFGDMRAEEAFRAVCAGHRLPRPRASTHEDVVQLIRDTTASDPSSRPAMAAVRHALSRVRAAVMTSNASPGYTAGGLSGDTPPAVIDSHTVSNPLFRGERRAWALDGDHNETADL